MTRRTILLLAGLSFCTTLAALGWWMLPAANGAFAPDLGDPVLIDWILQWDVHAFRTAPAHPYDANMFYPIENSLTRTENYFAVVPIFALFRLCGASNILAFNLTVVLAFWSAFFGVALLVYAWTERLEAAVLAGTIYAFLPLRFFEIGRLQLLTGVWTALAVLTWDRLRAAPAFRRGLLLGVLAVLQFASCVYLFFQLAVLLTLLGLADLFSAWRSRRAALLHGSPMAWRARVGALLGLTIGLVPLLPLALPYIAQGHQYPPNASFGTLHYYSATWLSLITMMPQNLMWGGLLGFQPPPSGAAPPLFCGAVACVLAVAAGLGRVPNSGRMAFVGLCAALLALGLNLSLPGGLPTPFEWLYDHVPGFSAQRVPWRYGLMLGLAMACLAGLGLKYLHARLSARAYRAVAGLSLAVAFLELLCPLPMAIVPPIPPIYSRLASQPRGPTLEIPMNLTAHPYPYPEGLRLYFSSVHWQPLVNGYPSIEPSMTDDISRYVKNGWTPAFRDLCSLLRLRYLVVHEDELPPAQRPLWRRLPAFAKEAGRDGTDVLYVLSPPAVSVASAPQVRLNVPAVAPAGRTLIVGLEMHADGPWFDSNAGTQTVRFRWQSATASYDGVAIYQCPALLLEGEVQVAALALPVPADPGRYRLDLAAPAQPRGHPALWNASAALEVAEETVASPDLRVMLTLQVKRRLTAGIPTELHGQIANLGKSRLLAGGQWRLGETWLAFRWIDARGRTSPFGLRALRIDLCPGQRYTWTMPTIPPAAGPARVEMCVRVLGGQSTDWIPFKVVVGAPPTIPLPATSSGLSCTTVTDRTPRRRGMNGG